MAYKTPIIKRTFVAVNESVQGEPLETKLERMITNREPISDSMGAPIYTERKEGVRASTNIRTDRWLIAVDATDKIAKSYKAKREERLKLKEDANKSAETESTQGTQQGQTKPAA